MGRAVLHSPRTAVEVFKLLPEGVYCQVINNVIYVSPPRTFLHQQTVMEIAFQIRAFVYKKSLGECVGSPVDTFLDKNNAFQPDIIFLSKKNLSLVKNDGKIHGAPDIIIEVLLKKDENHDKIRKRKVYESCGVLEYFIVDPQTKAVTNCYLKNKKFTEEKFNSKIVSKLLKKTFYF